MCTEKRNYGGFEDIKGIEIGKENIYERRSRKFVK